MAAIVLHKFGVLPEDEEAHNFTFIFENPHKIQDVKSVESSEVQYGGHKWTLVCMRKEDKYVGIYLKWKYTDGQSASAVSCRTKYSVCLVHRHDYGENKYFNSNQKFSSSQSLLGKSKFIQISELLDLSAGFLDETGKRIALELTLSKSTTRFEKVIDTSPNQRTKKNISGFYFDTSTFLLANHRWYLRIYPTKTNSNGLPAVYLYLASKAKGLSLESHFRLYVGEDSTEVLAYTFGEGAKFDGFGKTLTQPLYNVSKMTEVTVGVEFMDMICFHDQAVSLRAQNVYTPHLYKDYANSYQTKSMGRGGMSSLTPIEAFQDPDGNFWKMDIDRALGRLTIVFDKGVHHYQQNKTKLLCWSATLLSRDPDRSPDIEMRGEPLVGYFSNFIDDKGYKMPFPIDLAELEEKGNAFADMGGEIILRVHFISLQTVPLGMRAIPRFDYQARHLLRARRTLIEKEKGLESMREMAASRASLSMLDMSMDSTTMSARDERYNADNSLNNNQKTQLYKSYDSLDALSTGDMVAGDDDFGKTFFADLMKHIAGWAINAQSRDFEQDSKSDKMYVTSRDLFNGTREDVSTESGITVSDESSLLMEARPSPVDLGKQKEVVQTLVKFLQQRLPLRITECLQFGSLGTNTSTKNRMDVDLILFSPDLPGTGQDAWMPSLLHAASNFLQQACSNPDPFYPLPKCSYFNSTPYALQLTCGGVDVDIMFTLDWETEEGGGYSMLYDVSCQQKTPRGRQWCSLAAARLQKKFLNDQPNEVKEIIKIIKHWRNCVHWNKTHYRPNSYLISLLAIKAAEDTNSTDIKTVLQRFGQLVLVPELSIQWSTFYVPEKYKVDFEPPTPLVRDPSNPGVNIAESLPYWGQFRSETILWLKGLGVTVPPIVGLNGSI